MKRANINLIAKREDLIPTILYFAFEAEEGSEDNVRASLVSLLKQKAFEVDAFSAWVKNSFSHVGEEAQIEHVQYPAIYYDKAGFRVPYTFLLDANHSEALVWRWESRIFRGRLDQLSPWLERPRLAQSAYTTQ